MANRVEIGNLYGNMLRTLSRSEELYDMGEHEEALEMLMLSFQYFTDLIEKIS